MVSIIFLSSCCPSMMWSFKYGQEIISKGTLNVCLCNKICINADHKKWTAKHCMGLIPPKEKEPASSPTHFIRSVKSLPGTCLLVNNHSLTILLHRIPHLLHGNWHQAKSFSANCLIFLIQRGNVASWTCNRNPGRLIFLGTGRSQKLHLCWVTLEKASPAPACLLLQ